MGRKKLIRFAANENATNILQPGKELYNTIKGNWRSVFFKNNNPIVLELACGRGEYTTGLASSFPEKNFIGVDIKGSRLWVGSQFALENKLANVAFLRTYIQNLETYFAEKEIDELWITFPDPRPKDSDERRRLTHPRFLNMYKKILSQEGIVHFKTDNEPLFDYTLETLYRQGIKPLACTKDLYSSTLNDLHLGIKTRFEQMFTEKGFKINYMQFKLS